MERPLNLMETLASLDPAAVEHFLKNAGKEAAKVCAVLADCVEMSEGKEDDYLATPLRIASAVLPLDPALVKPILSTLSKR